MTLDTPARTSSPAAAQAPGAARDTPAPKKLEAPKTDLSPLRTDLSEAAKSIRDGVSHTRQDILGREKTRAREAVQRLVEELKIIKKVWANDPKELARQLARIAKQLAQAVKDYKAAAKATGEAILLSAAPAPAPAPPAAVSTEAPPREDAQAREDSAAAPDPAVVNAPDTDEPKADAPVLSRAEAREALAAYLRHAPPQPIAPNASLASAYGRVDDASKSAIEGAARADDAFINDVRGLMKQLKTVFTEAKIKAAFLARERDDPFKAAEEAFKAVEDDLKPLADDTNAVLNAINLDRAFGASGAPGSAAA
ncbi:hypothetical protein GC169_03640 [bacterium]|nr:hypothetical protein [bacterium]